MPNTATKLAPPRTPEMPPVLHCECHRLSRQHLARLEELNAQLARDNDRLNRDNDRLRCELGKVERAA